MQENQREINHFGEFDPLLDIVEVGMRRTLARAEQFLRRRLRVTQALVGHHLLGRAICNSDQSEARTRSRFNLFSRNEHVALNFGMNRLKAAKEQDET